MGTINSMESATLSMGEQEGRMSYLADLRENEEFRKFFAELIGINMENPPEYSETYPWQNYYPSTTW